MSGRRVVLLGYGMQGKACLTDLLNSAFFDEIVVADNLPDIAQTMSQIGDARLHGVQVDASDTSALSAVMKDASVVIELLPGIFALPVARLAAKLGVHLVSAMYLANPGEQDLAKRRLQQEELAAINATMQDNGCTILEEFGMDPGIDLVLGRKALDDLDKVLAFHSYGAGFPEKGSDNNPLHYKFTWSIVGVMRSYLRPSVIIKDGKSVAIPADSMFVPSSTHILDIPEMGGPLECFPNGDSSHFAEVFGIRNTVKNMGRYICRWPGHAAFWSVMAQCGFLSDEPIQVGSAKIAPSVFCATLLGSQSKFFYADHEKDVALVRTDARGIKNGMPRRVIYQIIDKRDLSTGLTAMQRTVGFPAAIGARMILDGRITKRGIVSPSEVDFNSFMEELGKRGIFMTRQEMEWDGNLEP